MFTSTTPSVVLGSILLGADTFRFDASDLMPAAGRPGILLDRHGRLCRRRVRRRCRQGNPGFLGRCQVGSLSVKIGRPGPSRSGRRFASHVVWGGSHASSLARIDNDRRRCRRDASDISISPTSSSTKSFSPRGGLRPAGTSTAPIWCAPGCSCFRRSSPSASISPTRSSKPLRLSLTDRSADGAFVGLTNYAQMSREPKFWEAMRNNMLC